MTGSWLLISLTLLLTAAPWADGRGRRKQSDTTSPKREGKVLSLFNIVRFPNSPCGGNAGRNGTCYTQAECTTRGGAGQGSCATGYGVCCVFAQNCGSVSSENCTYFESTGTNIGACSLKICKCDSSVCQLRLDFETFMISGPSTSSLTTGKSLGGNPGTGGTSVTQASRCLTDSFSVSNPGGNNPPEICGMNTGEHMYVDASSCCNTLTFQLGADGKGTGIANRQWSIKITQYSCNFENLAPKGCTQYLFGQDSASVQSYNFAGGQHLANQNQDICIRRERGNCRICYTTVADIDFVVSGDTAMMMNFNLASCCGYGEDGKMTKGFDCVHIPGAGKDGMTNSMQVGERFCGRSKGLGTLTMGAVPKTICSTRQPFHIRFQTNQNEFAKEAMKLDTGFRLLYTQDALNC